jgi:hypothetical protein
MCSWLAFTWVYLYNSRMGITIHGHKTRGAISPEYKTWLGMKARCYRPKNKDFPNWGGKGIRVCEKWRNDFMAFYADMGQKPSPSHTIDRLNPKMDYSPENCRWATPQQQGAENRTGLVPVSVSGMDFPNIAAACRHFGVSPTTVNERKNAGIPIDQLFTPGRLKSRRGPESYWKKEYRALHT